MSINLDRNKRILRAHIERLTENERPPNRGAKKVSFRLETIPEESSFEEVSEKVSKLSISALSYAPRQSIYTPSPPTSPTMPSYTPPLCKRESVYDFTAEELGLRAYTAEEIDQLDAIDFLEGTRKKVRAVKEEPEQKSSEDLKAELAAFKEAFLLQHLGDIEAWEVVDNLTDDLVGEGDINQIALKLGNLRKLEE